MFPGGQVAVDSADFDFTLLYKLIRNLVTGIPAPTRGWASSPPPCCSNEADNIERIRHLRNNLAHNSKLEISEADFSTYWTDLSEAIDILSKGTLSIDVKSMRMKSFDRCIKNEKEEDYEKQRKKCKKTLCFYNNRLLTIHRRSTTLILESYHQAFKVLTTCI